MYVVPMDDLDFLIKYFKKVVYEQEVRVCYINSYIHTYIHTYMYTYMHTYIFSGEAKAKFIIAAVKTKTMLFTAGVRHPSNLPDHL